jgi:SAM-dependent methyltransferase
MQAVDVLVSLTWQSRAGHHVDRCRVGPVKSTSDLAPLLPPESWQCQPGSRVAFALTPAADDRLRQGEALAGWRHSPPRLGRHYPRGLLASRPRADLLPFRVCALDATSLLADFNAPSAGRDFMVEIVAVPAAQTALTPTALAGWLAAGPGLQAPLLDADTDFLADRPFLRADETPDDRFYAQPRPVNHLDAATRLALTARYATNLSGDMDVLDLMASWNSHLPAALPLRVTGLGLNAEELAANTRLSERVVHDLNRQPVLPFPDTGFDAVLCALSIEYLTDPLAICREVARVLRPGGIVMVSFSDRWFPPKAIRLWPELHPFERLAFVSDLFRRAGGFDAVATESLLGLPHDDAGPHRRPQADPLYLVSARRSP